MIEKYNHYADKKWLEYYLIYARNIRNISVEIWLLSTFNKIITILLCLSGWSMDNSNKVLGEQQEVTNLKIIQLIYLEDQKMVTSLQVTIKRCL